MRIYSRGAKGILWVDVSVDGKRIKRSSGTTDRLAAEEYAATLSTNLWRTRRLGEAPRVVWDDAVLAQLKDFGHRRSIEDIKLRLRWLSDRLQGRPLAEINDTLIRKLAAERKAQPINARAINAAADEGNPAPGPRPSSNGTVNRHLAELSKILHYAHRRGWLVGMPPITKMHEPAKRVAWLTRQQARTLLLELPEHLRVMAAFSLATGLRETNVRLPCWQQVDMSRRVAWVYADQAKAGRDLNVPLNDEAMQVLEYQLGKHDRWVFPVPRWEEKVNPGDTLRQITDSPTSKISNHAWQKARVRAGVPWLGCASTTFVTPGRAGMSRQERRCRC